MPKLILNHEFDHLDLDFTFAPHLSAPTVVANSLTRLILSFTSSLALTQCLLLALRGADLVANVEQASDNRVDWEVADAARWQGKRCPTYRT